MLIIKKKDNVVLGEGPTQRLDNATITAELKDCINFAKSKKKFCLSLHFNGKDNFLL